MAAVRKIACSTFLLAAVIEVACQDVGLEGLFTTVQNVTRQCHYAAVPLDIDGSFVIAGPGVFEMGKYKFKATVDAFAQFYKFEVGSSQICFESKTMLTKFWNQSVEAQTVAPSILFADTEPPRPSCPKFEPMCDALGGNDNIAVNSVQVGDATLELTDAASATDVDWNSLQVIGKHIFVDEYPEAAHVLTTGSAHPIRVAGGYIAMVAEMPLVPKFAHNIIDFVKMSDADNGKTRTLLARMQVETGWYAHSFGITENFAILPMNVYMNMKLLGRQEMMNAFTGKWDGLAVLDLNQHRTLGPLQKPKMYQVEPFWHTHFANCYETADGSIVMDIVAFKGNMFNGPMVIFEELFNKTVRDSNPNRGLLKRMTLKKDGTTTTSILSHPNRQFDFVKINTAHVSKKHCYIYGSEYWHDDKTVYATAVGKIDVCSDSKAMTYWYREDWYPSEALFVERKGATNEDDGFLLFAALNGKTQNSHFLIVNAKDMSEISNTEFQGRAAFTIHAEFLTKKHVAPMPIVV